MSNEKIFSSKKFGKLIAVTGKYLLSNREKILISGTPVLYKHKEGNLSIIPPKLIDKYIGKNESLNRTFFVKKNWENYIDDEFTIHEIHNNNNTTNQEKDIIYEKIKSFKEMDMIERQQHILNNIHKLKKQIGKNKGFDIATVTDTVNVISDTIFINKATLEDNLENPLESDALKKLIDKTHLLIATLLRMLDQGIATYKTLGSLEHINTGSNSIDHMNRMVIRVFSFIHFYNSSFNAGTINKLRADFHKRYYKYYEILAGKLFKSEQKISLEIVFKKGVRRISSTELLEYTIGSLIHDIGKLSNVEYHDGDAPYNLENSIEHAFQGFHMISNTDEFSDGESAIVGLHHEYYGAPNGYKLTERLRKKILKEKDEKQLKYFISYNINDVINGEAFSYFPCKLIEIL